MKVRLAPAAEADFERIRDTIVSENPAAAERLQRSFARSIELLKFFPHLGRPGSVKGTREKPIKSFPYVIVYTVEAEELIVLRVYHGAQSRP
ncbi:MAG TPA: type II toxin-antitoxin system RelE/ParE family toxin [Hyphomicrobiales bacterium]|nr:type II toxin-antitoxin system RelE/ParE family toxin [Hyphomicrobiales bacterium]